MEEPKRKDGSELSLREWGVKAQSQSHKTKPRRHSASYIRTFHHQTHSFSAASSPAYLFKDGIDPTTYSFDTALRALQARSWYNNWGYLSPDGFELNSKWNEAERYICNPLSGEVPLECLSAKALSGRSFRIPTNQIHVSAFTNSHTNTSSTYIHQRQHDQPLHPFPIPEKKKREGMTRDVGTQSSTPYLLSSSSPTSASSPSLIHTSPILNAKSKSEQQGEERDKESKKETKDESMRKKEEEICRESGCFPWMKKKRLKEKGRHIKINIFVAGCQRKEAKI